MRCALCAAAFLLARGGGFAAAYGADAGPAAPPADAAAYERVGEKAAAPARAATTTAPAAAVDSSAATGAASAPSIAPAAAASAAAPAIKTETVEVPDSMLAPPYVKRGVAIPPTTTEIPQSLPELQSAGTGPDGQIVNYENVRNQPPASEPRLHSLQEFISEGDNTSPLGMEVREDRRKLKSGGEAEGLLVVGVTANSPAARAGLRAYRRTVRDLLEAASVAAALVFPPAVLAVPIFDQVHIGETYDLIIAVDGSRVANFLDFEDRMRDVQPGEIVYLSLIRNGGRTQLAVKVPAVMPPLF